jgi:replicative DNA helicase
VQIAPEFVDDEPDADPDPILDAEQALLGAMMLDRDTIPDVNAIVAPRDHERPAHTTIHQAINALFQRGEPCDPITVTRELASRGDLPRVGGASYVHGCIERLPSVANAEYYAEMIHERGVFRRLEAAGGSIANLGRQRLGNATEAVDKAQSELFTIAEERASEDVIPVGDTFTLTLDAMEERQNGDKDKLPGVPTGFADLDALTGGLRGGQMIVVAARPAMGKSTLALDFARSASVKHKLPSVFFSLEMGRQDIEERLISAQARVALHHIRQGTLTDDDWTRIGRHTAEILEAPLLLDTSTNLTVMDIRAKARRLAQKQDLKLVIVDYMQLMQSGGAKAETRQLEVTEISRNLKLLAKELDVPVVALSQLNRGPEQRADKRPMVSDLRESGSIEQDADMVILLHREDAYEKESPRAGEADLIVAKHRNGPTATITVAAALHYSMFIDMAQS